MPIDENGFLGEQISGFEKQIYQSNQSLFDMCFSLNNFAQRAKYQFEVPLDSREKKAAACFFIRVLNGFQGTVILQQKGLASEAIVVLRGAYEAFCCLKRVIEENGFLEKLLRDNDARRLSDLNWILNRRPSTVSPAELKAAKEEVVELKNKNISKNDRIVIENLHPQTYSFYRLFSSEAHPGLGAVVRYLQQNAEGADIIEWGPTSNDLEMTLISACTILFDSLSLISRMFQVDISSGIEAFRPLIDEAHKFLKKPAPETATE
jgi:hypothetical protein